LKKSLLALAVLGAFAGAASAQSAVTMFGVVDLNGRYVDNDGPGGRYTLSQDGINSSRLGFRGTEDLGGGLSAGFWLEAGVNADTGTTNAKFFNRRSTVSLIGGWGELRLGRDYSPTFWNMTIFDAFGTNGVGSSLNVSNVASSLGGAVGGAPINAPVYVRSDNSIGYFLPGNLGGLYGQAMMTAGEGGAGKYFGGRIGWASGPFDIAAAYGEVDLTADGNTTMTISNIGGSWKFAGGFTLLAQWNKDDAEGPAGAKWDEERYAIGARMPFGQHDIGASYVSSKVGGTKLGTLSDADMWVIGYQYNLSRRTALYGTYSSIDNKSNGVLAIPGGPPGMLGGGTSSGYEVGLRHSF